MDSESNVRVAIRIRPQVSSEILQKCSICTTVTPNEPQIWLGSDKAFTFDHVFDIQTHQNSVYENCVRDLVEGCFDGYNATVLAYGQTGSGKTYTMGSGFDMLSDSNQRGIIPRAIQHLFTGVEQRIQKAQEQNRPAPDFKISVQFLELYNEEIIDLLNDDRTSKANAIKIHEDPSGGIYTVGATSRLATSVDTVFQLLKKGALSRQTGSTNMNLQSSRSHAIFTITVKQQRISCWAEPQDSELMAEPELETLCAKFHFVDLAGSERLKRTGATGERAKEGISINSGLLALGNVISALGDRTKRAQHVPYRDSKLTRLLQDSLGGNSRTLMIACISPSDRDFMETLSTLRYANRAKNIRNKVLANQDKSSQTISLLRKQIAELEVELQEYRQGKRIVNTDGTEQINDMYHENRLLKVELSNIKTRLKALQDTHDRILANNAELLAQKELSDWSNANEVNKDLSEVVKKYFQEIEELRSKLIETEETCAQLRKQLHKQNRLSLTMSPYVNRPPPYTKFDVRCDETEEDILNKAKEEVNELKRKLQNCAAQKAPDGQDAEANEEECDDCDEELEDVQDEESNHSAAESEEEPCPPELELANLANEIMFKERLISELEKSHKKIDQIRQSYEDRLKDFQERYVLIENERDQVLSKLNSESDKSNSAESAKKICDKYEKKLARLREDIRKLQTMRRQHEEKTKNHYEGKLRTLKCNVEDLKRQKVRLVNQMKEENMRHRENDRIKTKTILQLTKQERVKDVKIRNLEKETDRYRSLLKRKDDEMLHLKKKIKPINQRNLSRATSGRNHNNHAQRLANLTITKMQTQVLHFSPIKVKQKWQQLQQTISKIILDKQKIAAQEHQMERYLVQREELGKQLDKAHRKYELALQSNQSEVIIRELQEEIDNYEANIKYLNQNLNECQSLIMSIEEQKEELENVDFRSFLSCGVEEMKYLFEKLLHFALHNGMVAQQKEEERREFELKYKQMANSSMIQEDLLQQLFGTDLFPAEPSALDNKEEEESVATKMEMGSPGSKENAQPITDLVASVTNGPIATEEPNHLAEAEVHIARFEQLSRNQDKPPTEVLRASNASNQLNVSSSRGRRLTMTPIELEESMLVDDKMTQSLCGQGDTVCLDRPISRVPSAPALKELPGRMKMEISPSIKRRNGAQMQAGISRQISSDLSESTPPASPPANRRIREDNVFYRLTSNMNHHSSPMSGVISRFNGKTSKSSYLVCSHVAEGHNRPVLSVVATEKLMLSGSKDGTAKVWDLGTGKELQSLREHPDSVVCVRYDEASQLAFTVSKCFIKVWDLRESPTKFVKTMSSNGIAEFCPSARQTDSGDPRIYEVQLNPQGTKLFSTCSQIVRVWDLRMFHAIGKLNSNHQSNITCMAVEDSPQGYITVVTGSKDRYLKVFDFPDGAGGCILPRCTFEPPHLDGVSAVALHKSLLFSASRDGNIKQWDLQCDLGKNLNSNHTAHKDSVLSLHITDRFAAGSDMPRVASTSSASSSSASSSSASSSSASKHCTADGCAPLLISSCKGGRIKLWDAQSFTPLAEVKAHQASVHSVYSNSSFIFTGSSDCTIGLWRRRTSTDPSPDYNEDFASLV